MQIVDLHIHSKYARACSKQLDLEHIEHWCKIKGIDVVACGDFTHPIWFKELESKLEPTGNGFYKLAKPSITVEHGKDIMPPNPKEVLFTLGTEVSCIYSQGGSVRRIHLLVIFSNLEHVRKFNAELSKRGGKLASDGRPILGMTAIDIAQIALEISEDVLLIPAHVWTPWFAIFGSKSGFDSVEECFGDYAKYIYGLETGLSSDPAMNWMLSKNDKYTLVSNSDAHSLENLGREANVIDLPALSYTEMFSAIKEGDPYKFKYTIEFFPEEGKYHMDGHAACKFSCEPEETRKLGGRCPDCGKKITVGVLSRVNELADRKLGKEKPSRIPYKSIIPLAEIISDAYGVGKKSKKVMNTYKEIINSVGNEFYTLLEGEIEAITKASSDVIAQGVQKVREGKVEVKGGYDGIYGEINIFTDDEREQAKGAQKKLL